MAEVASSQSKERCQPAALRPWRTMERSAWTKSLILITTILSEEENSQSANRLLVTVPHSAAQDFQLETPDQVFGSCAGVNIWWESFTKRWKIRKIIGLFLIVQEHWHEARKVEYDERLEGVNSDVSKGWHIWRNVEDDTNNLRWWQVTRWLKSYCKDFLLWRDAINTFCQTQE